MSYSFRGSNDNKTIAVPSGPPPATGSPAPIQNENSKMVTQSPKEVPNPDNPFMDAPPPKIEEVKNEPANDVENVILKNKAQGDKKQQILASPNFMLLKKGVNKKAPIAAKGALSRFGAREPEHTNGSSEKISPEKNENAEVPQKSIALISSTDSGVKLGNQDTQNTMKDKLFSEEKNQLKENGLYSSPRNNGACCDAKYVNSKIVSCECIIL